MSARYAVTDVDGNVLEGTWATHDEAWELGACGRYLFSGFDVIEVTE